MICSSFQLCLVTEDNLQGLLNSASFYKRDFVSLKCVLLHVIRDYLIAFFDFTNFGLFFIGKQNKTLWTEAATGLFNLYY